MHCIAEDCNKAVYSKGFCRGHYEMQRRYGRTKRVIAEKRVIAKCAVGNCSRLVDSKGYCTLHYKRLWRHGDVEHCEVRTYIAEAVCEIFDCDRRPEINGICKMHYLRLLRHGRSHVIRARAGEGRTLTKDGYIIVTVDGQRKYEHTVIAEKALGKTLPPKAIVHHVNGVPWDNRPENLVICPDQAYHMLLHKRMRDLNKSPLDEIIDQL